MEQTSQHWMPTPHLDAVRVLESYGRRLPVDFLANETGLSRSEINRVLKTLRSKRIVVFNPNDDTAELMK